MFAYCLNNPVILTDSTGLCSYNGTYADFIRLNQGLPSMDCNCIKHNVPLYSQKNYHLCWAFCQTMVEDYLIGKVSTQEEAEKKAIKTAISVNGQQNWNRGNWPTNTGKEIKDKSFDNIYNALSEGPLYAFYYNHDTTHGHLVVVTGINKTDKLIYTNNPWGGSGSQTFSEFQNCFLGGNGIPLVSLYYVEQGGAE